MQLRTVKEMEPKSVEVDTLIKIQMVKEGFELRYLTGLESEVGFSSTETLVYSTLYSLSKWVKNKYRRVDEDGNVWVQGQADFLLSTLGWSAGKIDTLRRTLKKLEQRGVIVSQQGSTYNRAKWYHLVGTHTVC